jgi:hypothetical protein
VALIVAEDAIGPWAAVECDRRGCFGHVTIRPIGSEWSTYDMACEAFDQAEAEGWRLAGSTYCPKHAQERPGRSTRLADGFSWARTAVEGVKGGQRPT